MRAQDFIANETQRAMESLIHQVKRVPADKVDWKPMDEGRSALSQLQECAVIAGFYPMLFQTLVLPDFTEEMMQQFQASCAALDTQDKAEAALRENTAKTIEGIKAMPDEKLENEMKFFGPEPWKVVEVLNAHAWNMHYHTGQVCYIQTLLGDKQMG